MSYEAAESDRGDRAEPQQCTVAKDAAALDEVLTAPCNVFRTTIRLRCTPHSSRSRARWQQAGLFG